MKMTIPGLTLSVVNYCLRTRFLYISVDLVNSTTDQGTGEIYKIAPLGAASVARVPCPRVDASDRVNEIFVRPNELMTSNGETSVVVVFLSA
jgi:hypothetical protein